MKIQFYYAEWCSFSQKMLPSIRKLQVEFPNLEIQLIDIDAERVESIGSIPLLVAGDQRVEGYQLIKPLRSFLRSL